MRRLGGNRRGAGGRSSGAATLQAQREVITDPGKLLPRSGFARHPLVSSNTRGMGMSGSATLRQPIC
eukprot:9017587-Pyramimonas_sp.AAC.1